MLASLAMTRNVVCIGSEDTLQDAHEIMTEWDIRHLPVLTEGKLSGMLSDRDILLNGTKDDDNIILLEHIRVGDAMSKNPFTCSVQTPIGAICEMMLEHKTDSVCVVEDDGDLVGLVTTSDLLQLLLAKETTLYQKTLPFRYKVHGLGDKTRRSQAEKRYSVSNHTQPFEYQGSGRTKHMP